MTGSVSCYAEAVPPAIPTHLYLVIVLYKMSRHLGIEGSENKASTDLFRNKWGLHLCCEKLQFVTSIKINKNISI